VGGWVFSPLCSKFSRSTLTIFRRISYDGKNELSNIQLQNNRNSSTLLKFKDRKSGNDFHHQTHRNESRSDFDQSY
jgi:hypothetical protein